MYAFLDIPGVTKYLPRGLQYGFGQLESISSDTNMQNLISGLTKQKVKQ